MMHHRKPILMFIVNVDWFFISHRLAIAQKAIEDGYDVHIATTITDGQQKLEKCGLTVHPIMINRSGSNAISGIQTFIAIQKTLAKCKPDILHLITIKPVLLGGIAAQVQKIPAVIAAISGLGYVFLAKGYLASIRKIIVGALYRLALKHSNCRVIFQNNEDRKTVQAMAKIGDESTFLIGGSGVRLDIFTSTPLPSGPPIVMLAARLLRDKGIAEFFKAAQILKAKKGTSSSLARFVLVGAIDPDNPASLTPDILDQWQRENVVELWGHRSNMPATLSEATIVVLPSYREGFPKVLMEAAASARAVITTDVPGCRDAIKPGITGMLVPARDPVALANAIEELLEERDLCEKFGVAGRKFAEEAFDVNLIVARHMAIYADMLQRNKAT